ncbi:MAG: DUF4405 domain-containing protein [Gammaproteobacteria bacterium]|nr:DUF4405 domain-containing protein [Gammaproteobacteria bacterium]
MTTPETRGKAPGGKRRHGPRWRAFVAFVVTWAFLVSTLTGIVLYVVPEGRVAYWTDWVLLGLTKNGWGDVHILLGLVFIVSGVIHLVYNWKPFKGYLADRVKGQLHLRGELVGSLALTVALVAGAVGHWPPVDWIFDLNDAAKNAWITAPEYEPPFGHAEEATLEVLARRSFIDPERARETLRAAGVDLLGPRASFGEIAHRNGTTPMALFMRIAPLAEPPPPPAEYTPEAVEERFTGTGVGRKSVAELCAETGTDPALALQRLRAAGIKAAPEETARNLADRHGLQPIQVLQVMLIGPGILEAR